MAMEREQILDRIKSIVVDQLGVDEKEVKMDAAYIDDLGADSLDIVELIMAFEEEFNIEIPDDVAEKIKTVKDTVDYIDDELNPIKPDEDEDYWDEDEDYWGD